MQIFVIDWQDVLVDSSDLPTYLAATYQPLLVSGTSIKTINGQSLLGAGNIAISVDLSGYLPIAGGTMAGNLDMDHYQISNVQAIDSDEITLNGLPVASEQYASNASNLSSGTVSDNRLSSNVPLKNAANTFSANQTLSGLSTSIRSANNPDSSASSTGNMQTFLTQLKDGADVSIRGYRGRWVFDVTSNTPVINFGNPAGPENSGFWGDGVGKPIGNGYVGFWSQHACRFWVGPTYVGTTNAIIGWNTSTTTWLDTYFKKTAVGSVSLCQNPSNTGEVAASLTVANLTGSVVAVGAGSAAACSVQIAGAGNGFYQAGASSIGVAVGGSQRAQFWNDGSLYLIGATPWFQIGSTNSVVLVNSASGMNVTSNGSTTTGVNCSLAKFTGYPTSLLPAAASNAGAITYDTTISKHVGCNGSSWNALW